MSGAAGLALNTACYTYVPLTTAAPVRSMDVRVQLTSEGTTELARYLGPRVAAVDGHISAVGADDAMVLGVSWVQLLSGPRQAWSGDGPVTVPKAYVANVQRRMLNRRKSYVAGVTITGAVLLLTAIALNGGGGQAPQEPIGDGGIGLLIRAR